MTLFRLVQVGVGVIATMAMAHAGTIEDIQSLLNDNKFDEAYAVATGAEANEAGNPDFDFVLGLAALESGHYSQAAFAFERVLIVDPQQHRARLELARVHFLQENFPSAQTEFETVLAQNPPPNVQTRIKEFLQAITERRAAAQRERHVYVDTSTGYDGNINSATGHDSVNVPALGIVELTSSSQELEDGFGEIGIGGSFMQKLTRQHALSVAADARHRNSFSYHEFDTDTGTIRTAYELAKPNYRFSVPLQFQQLNVDGKPFRRMTTLSAELAVPHGNSQMLSYFAMVGAMRFPEFSNKEADLVNAGVSWQRAVPGSTWSCGGGVYYGYEDPLELSGEHNGRRYGGVRAQLQKIVSERATLSAGVAYQVVHHIADDPVFVERREDEFYQVTLTSIWQWRKNWSASFGVEDYINRSNIDIYDYDRIVAKVGLSYAY